jgi:hypothetical protein
MNISARTLFAFIAGSVPALVSAQEAVPALQTPVASAVVTPTDPGPAQGYVRLPANTPVDLEIAGALSSKTSKIDEMFPIRLRSAIMVDGKVILPAGTTGQGQVVHAAKARAMGKAGEMILAARYLECGPTRIVLRGFRFGLAATGKDESTQVLVLTATFGAPFMFISGGEMIVPVGSPAQARLLRPADIRMEPVPDCPAPVADSAVAAAPAAVTTPAVATAPATTPDVAKAVPVSVQSK